MRLLLDQNLSRDLPALLAGAAFDVADTRSLDMQRWTDEAITDYAAAEDRVIVSADTDFGAILAARQSAKPSFVLLRRTKQPVTRSDRSCPNFTPRVPAEVRWAMSRPVRSTWANWAGEFEKSLPWSGIAGVAEEPHVFWADL